MWLCTSRIASLHGEGLIHIVEQKLIHCRAKVLLSRTKEKLRTKAFQINEKTWSRASWCCRAKVLYSTNDLKNSRDKGVNLVKSLLVLSCISSNFSCSLLPVSGLRCVWWTVYLVCLQIWGGIRLYKIPPIIYDKAQRRMLHQNSKMLLSGKHCPIPILD